ncbi:lysine N(6)-hydroxylase/L-ornithine N(5)-oxygenase family protein [Halorussus sp. MSC15.2]|uniref:lysine N(6)-hydroxylase/L-ornithine N(5)-oxygenase family protein n=1 Tax=Halorussus sp. MSC15.2 TaxID=2283638 RepID=UPI0013D6E1EB|nr:lysine N(6)-hydroxylase/L-ornithine N(5)-oxygenase family protein [Halorussus sp. MSC15.2]NEU57253.1 lysine N(6)-hydroxylase/L-ornithine N(5)-oxygenase family protein [Halorussus sp. MSC15.2]
MSRIRDVIGVGLGPFNLGLAALLDGANAEVDALFLEQDDEFAWHEGMLIEGTTLEVPFLADLVTMADPTNPHSYLNYLRERDRLYEFYFYETFQIPRREYDDYLRWVAERLGTCRFGRRVESVAWVESDGGGERGSEGAMDGRRGGEDGTDGHFVVTAQNPATGEERTYRARNLALGVGSRPFVPEDLRGHPENDVFHTAEYRFRRDRCLDADSITVVGSGQSAAEVFHDLLDRQSDADYRLDWLTRSEGFFPMEYSKLGLQHFTPEYVEYFYDLPDDRKDEIRAEQDLLYKGIDPETSAAVYDLLYERSVGDRDPDVGLFAMTEVEDIDAIDAGEASEPGANYRLDCRQWQTDESFVHESDVVILGTGYHRPVPEFLAPIEDRIGWDEKGRYRVTEDHRLVLDDVAGDVFVQNGDLHSHGVGAPDLGLGCYRNSRIVNRLVGREVYPEDADTVYQDFAVEQFVNRRGRGRRDADTGREGARARDPESAAPEGE